MRKTIFLDIDGVLNCVQSLRKNNEDRLFYGRLSVLSDELRIKWHLSYLDFETLVLLKMLCVETNADIVITSGWKDLNDWPLIEEKLVDFGLPISGVIDDTHGRGNGIISYVRDNDIEKYAILDDDIFRDYDDELMARLVYCDNYDGGFTELQFKEALSILGEQEKTLKKRESIRYF